MRKITQGAKSSTDNGSRALYSTSGISKKKKKKKTQELYIDSKLSSGSDEVESFTRLTETECVFLHNIRRGYLIQGHDVIAG